MDLQFLLDENLRGPLWHALARHNAFGKPFVDVMQVGDVPGLSLGTGDQAILCWSEQANRILVTADFKTMPGHFANHLASGGHHPGMLLVRRRRRLIDIVDALALIAQAGRADEYRDSIQFIS